MSSNTEETYGWTSEWGTGATIAAGIGLGALAVEGLALLGTNVRNTIGDLKTNLVWNITRFCAGIDLNYPLLNMIIANCDVYVKSIAD